MKYQSYILLAISSLDIIRGLIMKLIFSIAALILIPAISLAEAPVTDGPLGFVLWNSELIQTTADRLEKELGDKHMVYQTIGNYEGHSM